MRTTSKHIENRRKVAEALKQQVCEWLNWDEFTYAEFQYECGLRYLRNYIPHDPWGQDMLQRSAIFWNWWKNLWSQRDASFCDVETEEGLRSSNMIMLRSIYRHLHDPAKLASDIYPNKAVLEESYNQMIAQLINETINA